MYSQHDEEKYILEALPEPTGRLLDLGAHSPTQLSNSRALIERGWEAVLVDASPGSLNVLIKEYRDHPRVTVVQAAVGHDGLVKWWDSLGDAVSTASIKQVVDWKSRGYTQYTPMYVAGVTTRDFLAHFPGPYDFIDIDTESTSDRIFAKCLACNQRPRFYLVEYVDGPSLDAILVLAHGHGYSVHRRFPGNIMFKRD